MTPTKSASAPKTKKNKVEKLAKETVKKTAASVKAEEARDTKYIYPEAAKSPLQKKAFRRIARQNLKRLQKAIDLGKGQEKEKAVKELQAYRKQILSEA